MSETKHAPGPWTVLSLGNWPLYIYAKRGMMADFHHLTVSGHPEGIEGDPVCRMRGVGAGMASDGTQLANAHLIAAAPDLLAACEYLVNFCERADIGQDGQGESFDAALDGIRAAIKKATGE